MKLKEVAQLLKVSEKTIYRWIKDGKIPFYRLHHQYRFRGEEINQWAASNKYIIPSGGTNDETEDLPVSVIANLAKGGIFYHVSGDNMAEVLKNAVSLINIPQMLDRNTVLDHLIRREEMADTSVGNGIAFPHPRNPIIPDPVSESLSICFLNKPMQYYALDDVPIHTIFILLNSSQKRHLKLLSKLSFLCRQEKFVELLKQQALREEIMGYISGLSI